MFACEPIAHGELIASYAGEAYEEGSEIGILFNASLGYLKTSYDFVVDRGNAIHPRQMGNETAFINTRRKDKHLNCEASPYAAGAGHHMAILARRDIRRGEELFLSYGDDYRMPAWDAEEESEEDGGESSEDEREEYRPRAKDKSAKKKLAPLSEIGKGYKPKAGRRMLWL